MGGGRLVLIGAPDTCANCGSGGVTMADFIGSSGPDTLDGSSGNDTLVGKGGDDTLNGLDGNDVLNGGIGADAMTGGNGDDFYYVDDAGDTTIENSGEGLDSVAASLSWTLADNVEQLRLTGTADLSGTGNALVNVIVGNSGANTLSGLDGNDELIGNG